MDSDDIILSGMANLSFNIKLSLTADPKRALVSNIGRAIVKKLTVKFEVNEILDVDNFDMFLAVETCRKQSQKSRMQCSGHTENCMKFQINALDKNASKQKKCSYCQHIALTTP